MSDLKTDFSLTLPVTEQQFRDAVTQCFANIVVNKDSLIVYVNQMAESLFGYARKELVGQPIEQLLPDLILTDIEKRRDSYFRNAATRPIENGSPLPWKRKDGAPVWLVGLSTGFFEGTGQFCAIVLAEIPNYALPEKGL